MAYKTLNAFLLLLATIMAVAIGGPAGAADTVKITPLGSHRGEFCALDRAMIFEDPNGTRVLYDAGRTVAGVTDPRLGKIDAVLVSHVHGDHIGDRHIKAVNAGSCAKPDASMDDTPDSNSVRIAVAKHSKIVTGSEMADFFAHKLEAAGGNPDDSVLVRFGAMTHVGGVGITTVTATHSNGLEPALVGGSLGKALAAAGLTVSLGPPTGYVLTFTNGLVVYLSGDTGITADQKTVVHDYYHPDLAVMNIGDKYTTGPAEAAYVIDDLVQPNAVIPSHANQASTRDGEIQPGTRAAAFMKATDVHVYVPLSGRTLAFDADGGCTADC